MKFKNIIYPCFCLTAAFFLSGCVATTGEMVDLKDEIYQLQLKLNEVQKNQADLSSKMDTLTSSMDALTSKLDETNNNMSMLGQRLDDVESNLSRKMTKISEPAVVQPVKVSSPTVFPAPVETPQVAPVEPVVNNPPSSGEPSKIYKLAYSDYSKGKYELAVEGFGSYLSEYPKGELADQAVYYLGESYYSLGQWNDAADEFDTVLRNFPKSGLVPGARLKKALCMEQLNKTKEMMEILKSIVKDFPNSPESSTAKQKLDTYRNNDK